MSSFRCKFCDDWLEWGSNGKLLNGNGSVHDCPNSPWKIAKRSRARARAYKKQELRKVDDHALLSDISDWVRHWNSRLANYSLDLRVNKKFPESEGEEA